MTITASDMLLYAGALFLLFMTPGPVWVALVARTLSGGFNAAWPLALDRLRHICDHGLARDPLR